MFPSASQADCSHLLASLLTWIMSSPVGHCLPVRGVQAAPPQPKKLNTISFPPTFHPSPKVDARHPFPDTGLLWLFQMSFFISPPLGALSAGQSVCVFILSTHTHTYAHAQAHIDAHVCTLACATHSSLAWSPSMAPVSLWLESPCLFPWLAGGPGYFFIVSWESRGILRREKGVVPAEPKLLLGSLDYPTFPRDTTEFTNCHQFMDREVRGQNPLQSCLLPSGEALGYYKQGARLCYPPPRPKIDS